MPDPLTGPAGAPAGGPTGGPSGGPVPGAAALVAALSGRGLTAATAESLTAGLVSARIADVPGASAVLRGGVVAYVTDLKASVLGVDAALLAAVGPIHPEVALQMARGVAALTGADVGVATTGVAGPGPADGHPAGTVVVAAVLVARPGTPRADPAEVVRVLHLPGDRPAVRAAAVDGALTALADLLAGNS